MERWPASRKNWRNRASSARWCDDADRHRDHPRKEPGPVVFDGPFAETKEQLLGFYVVNVASQDEAARLRASCGCEPGGVVMKSDR